MATITQRVTRRLRTQYKQDVLTRAQWGSVSGPTYAKRRKLTAAGNWGRFIHQADTVAQHITVTSNDGDFAAACRTVERIGNERFGCGVSYNYLIHPITGQIAEGQPLDSKGVHTINDKNRAGYSKDQNLAARAFAIVGMPGTPLSDKAKHAIACLLAAMMDEDAITTTFDYQPHSFFAYKDCPCDATRDAMPGIRAAAFELRKPAPAPQPAPEPAPVDHTDLRVFVAPMQYSDTSAQQAADTQRIFSRKAHIIIGTEAGPGSGDLRKHLRTAAKRHGYRLHISGKGGDGWVAVRRNLVDGAWRTGTVPVLDGSGKTGDPHRHGPKTIAWASFYNKQLGTISVGAFHMLTKGRYPGQAQEDKPHDPVDHYAANIAYGLALEDWAAEAGRGNRLVFVGGDSNLLLHKNPAIPGPFTSCWAEVGKFPNTGHGCIDGVWTYNRDGRVSCLSARAFTDKQVQLHSDHFLIKAVYRVAHLAVSS